MKWFLGPNPTHPGIESKDLNKISCWGIINRDMLSFVSFGVLESTPRVSLRLLHVRIETILLAANNHEYDMFSIYSMYIL